MPYTLPSSRNWMPIPRELDRIWSPFENHVVDTAVVFRCRSLTPQSWFDDAIVTGCWRRGRSRDPGAYTDHDCIVAADDVAVADFDVAAVVGGQCVAVGDVQQVAIFMPSTGHFSPTCAGPSRALRESPMSRISRSRSALSTNILGRKGLKIHHRVVGRELMNSRARPSICAVGR